MTLRTEKIQRIYNDIQDVNTYIGLIHNFLKFYKASKQFPNSKALKIIFYSQYISLRATSIKWKFARSLYKNEDVRKKLEQDLCEGTE